MSNSELLDAPVDSSQSTAMSEVASSRAAQEVQAAMIIAKKYPRDEHQALLRILRACKRQRLAEAAIYTYPRGGTKVEGPSIRLAEAMAQSWGNLDFGVIEVEQKNGESSCQAYCWDLETNTRQTKVFTVKHIRHTRNGQTQLTDPRDIYEMVANQGARRVRACILGVIPGDIVDEAVEEVNKTLKSQGGDKPIGDRVRAMCKKFDEQGVTTEMLESRLKHKLEATTESELVDLGKIFNSIRDGQSKREDWFEFEPPKGGKAKAVDPKEVTGE